VTMPRQDGTLQSEMTWTPPSAWCPHPRHWHAESVDATEREVALLVGALVVAVQPDVVVESGSNTGQTSELIGYALLSNGHGHCWSAERLPEYAALASARVAGLPVTIVHEDTASWVPPDGIGLAFLDSSIAGRAGELAAWRPRFLPGAVVVVHDTAPHHATMATLGPVLGEGWLASVTLRTPRGVTIGVVTEEARDDG
jgi:hypothetical protein